MNIFSTRAHWRRYKTALHLVGSCARAGVLLDVHLDLMMLGLPWTLENAIFLRIVGQTWSDIDGDRTDLIDTLCGVWSDVESAEDFLRWIQPAPARRAHAALPDKVRAFRGCYEGVNDDGICFSLDRAIAEGFVGLARYYVDGAQPVLIAATLPKKYIFRVIDRDEDEVVCLFPDVFGKRRHVRRLDREAARVAASAIGGACAATAG